MSTEDVRHLLEAMGRLPPESTIDDSDSLFETGVIDSIGLMELVTRIESTFHIQVLADDLSPDNFDSIEQIARYIRERGGQ